MKTRGLIPLAFLVGSLGVCQGAETKEGIFSPRHIAFERRVSLPPSQSQAAAANIANEEVDFEVMFKRVSIDAGLRATAMFHAFRTAPDIELISLDPQQQANSAPVVRTSAQPSEIIDNFIVLSGSKISSRETIIRFASAFESAVRSSDGQSAECFVPHPAFRFSTKQLGRFTVVICFECTHGYFRLGDDLQSEVECSISSSAKAELDQFFPERGLKKAL